MASLIDPPTLQASFPEFAATDTGLLQIWIDFADQEINPDAWGSRAIQAESFLAAHYVTLALRKGGIAGAQTGARVGDVSVSYSAPLRYLGGGLDPSLATTSYGLAYARLIQLTGFGFATTGCP